MTAGQPGSFAAPSAPAPGKTEPPGPCPVPGQRQVPGLAQGPGTGSALPVLPALRGLLPRGGLARGSVVAVAEFGLLCLALAAAASADGAWCGIAGIPEAGVLAAAALGLDAGRTLLVPDPGPSWPQVVASLLDGCELVLLRPPARASAQVRQRLEATLRRGRGVLLVAGDWPGAQLRLRVASQRWTGLGDGHGRLRACCAEVAADGRGEAAMTRTRWLWLPGEDGGVAVADPADLPFDIDRGTAGSRARPAGGERVSARRPAADATAAADHGRDLPGPAQRRPERRSGPGNGAAARAGDRRGDRVLPGRGGGGAGGVRVRRPRSGPLLRRRDGAGRQDHRRAGGPRRATARSASRTGCSPRSSPPGTAGPCRRAGRRGSWPPSR